MNFGEIYNGRLPPLGKHRAGRRRRSEVSLPHDPPVSKLAKPVKLTAADAPAIDRVFEKMLAEYSAASYIEVHLPETDSSSIAANATLG